MKTLVATRKMSPALAARVEASVSGGRSRSGALSPRIVAAFRFVAVSSIVAALSALLLLRHRLNSELERRRDDVLLTVSKARASLTPSDKRSVTRSMAWLERASGAYDGDLVAKELAFGGLDSALARGVLYVRGALAAFTSEGSVAAAMAASRRDAFLFCLLDPPKDKSEGAVLGRVRAAYGGPRFAPFPANGHRLYDADVALRFLAPAWEARVRAATGEADVEELARQLARAPIDEGKRAAAAATLVFVLDEPNEPGGVTELDGEHAHFARVGVVDLASGRPLLRQRRRLDPAWISLPQRPRYASGLDACALAIDVRAAVPSSPGSPAFFRGGAARAAP